MDKPHADRHPHTDRAHTSADDDYLLQLTFIFTTDPPRRDTGKTNQANTMESETTEHAKIYIFT